MKGYKVETANLAQIQIRRLFLDSAFSEQEAIRPHLKPLRKAVYVKPYGEPMHISKPIRDIFRDIARGERN